MGIGWNDLLTALALLLVLEGVLPFASPESLRRALAMALQQDDRVLRTIGLLAMLTGLALLAVVR